MTEGLRLWLVVQALGFPDVQLGLSGAVFVALIGSLLTAIPLSPAGLGFAQAGVIGVLTVAYKVPLAEATAITILDNSTGKELQVPGVPAGDLSQLRFSRDEKRLALTPDARVPARNLSFGVEAGKVNFRENIRVRIRTSHEVILLL